MSAILGYNANKLRIIMPFFPGQMDRELHYGDVATAKYLAAIISGLPS
jgi:hypothetical protein